MAAAAGSVLARCHVEPANYLAGVGLDLDVQVRRQDTTVETVKLHQEYERFLKKEFPNFYKEYLQFPEVFGGKVKDATKAIEGFYQKEKRQKKNDNADEAEWHSRAAGDQAESDLFHYLQKHFFGRPAMSYNGFQMGKVFKVAKETVKEEREKRRKQHINLLDVDLSNNEKILFKMLGQQISVLNQDVETIMVALFDQIDLDVIDEASLKINIEKGLIAKDNKGICKQLLGKIAHIFKTQVIERDLNRGEIQSFVSAKLYDQITKKNQEFDQFIIDRKSSTFMHFEIKSVERLPDNFSNKNLKVEYEKACKQIKLGKEMFLRFLAPNRNLSSNWAYQGKSS